MKRCSPGKDDEMCKKEMCCGAPISRSLPARLPPALTRFALSAVLLIVLLFFFPPSLRPLRVCSILSVPALFAAAKTSGRQRLSLRMVFVCMQARMCCACDACLHGCWGLTHAHDVQQLPMERAVCVSDERCDDWCAEHIRNFLLHDQGHDNCNDNSCAACYQCEDGYVQETSPPCVNLTVERGYTCRGSSWQVPETDWTMPQVCGVGVA